FRNNRPEHPRCNRPDLAHGISGMWRGARSRSYRAGASLSFRYIRRSLEQWFHVFHVNSAQFGQQDLLLGCGVFQAENLADERPRTPTGRALWEADREELFPERRGTARHDGEAARGAGEGRRNGEAGRGGTARRSGARRRGTARCGGEAVRGAAAHVQGVGGYSCSFTYFCTQGATRRRLMRRQPKHWSRPDTHERKKYPNATS